MATDKGRGRYPARITFQVSAELKERLLEVAGREHGGDLQALGRQCLQARVDGSGAVADQQSEILEALERLRQEFAGRNEETFDRLNELLAKVEKTNETLTLSLTDIMAIRDSLPKPVE